MIWCCFEGYDGVLIKIQPVKKHKGIFGMKKNALFYATCAVVALFFSVCFLSVGSRAATRVFTKAGNSYADSYSLGELKYLYSQLDLSGTESYSETPSTEAPYAAGKLSAGTVTKTVDVINFYRRLAHLDPVSENKDSSVYAQHAALVNCVNNTLSHYPSQPADMPDNIFEKGYTGASSSNLGWGYSLQGSIAGYLDDSDSSNISRVGHRRWLLNPVMGKVGLGKVGTYSALYVRDKSNATADADFVTWPGGNEQFPSDFFDRNEAWSIHLMSKVFEAPVMSQVSVTLTRISDGKKITFGSNSTAGRFFISAEKKEVVGNATYISNIIADSHALIFAPDGYFGDYNGAYKVVVTGLKTCSGESAKIEYTVNFNSFADTQAVPVGGAATTEKLSDASVTLSATKFTYNGSMQRPTVTVKNAAGQTLTKDQSYTVTYSAGSKIPGSYTVTVTGKGNYSGTVKKTYTIAQQPLNSARVTLSAASFTYNCHVQRPTVTVKSAAGGTLTQDTSYTVTYSAESKVPGTYTVTVTGKGCYTGTVSKKYTIAKQPLSASRVTLSWTSKPYSGSVQKPAVTVKNAAGGTMTLNSSYTLSWSGECKAAGTYTVTVTGKGYYTGTVTKYKKKKKQALADSRVTLSWTSKQYNCGVQKPTVTVKNAAGGTMTLNASYTVTYSAESKAPGTYKVTVTAKGGNYTGTVEKTYQITKQPLAASRVTLSPTSFTYTGRVQKPSVTVKNVGGGTMTLDRSYTVSYSGDCKAKGTYTVTITGKGYYTGTVTKTFTIK